MDTVKLFSDNSIQSCSALFCLLYHIQTAENKGVTESHNFLIEKDKLPPPHRPPKPFFRSFL